MEETGKEIEDEISDISDHIQKQQLPEITKLAKFLQKAVQIEKNIKIE